MATIMSVAECNHHNGNERVDESNGDNHNERVDWGNHDNPNDDADGSTMVKERRSPYKYMIGVQPARIL